MQNRLLLMWLLVAYSWDRLSCWNEQRSCIEVEQTRSQCDVVNITRSTADQSQHRPPLEFDLLMLQIDRVSMLYPDGEVTRMLSRITKLIGYDMYNEQVLRIPADSLLQVLNLYSAPKLQTIKVLGSNNALKSLQVLKSAMRSIPTSLHLLQGLHSLVIENGALNAFSLEPLHGIRNLTFVYLRYNHLQRLVVSRDSKLVISIDSLKLSNNLLEFVNMEFFKPFKQLRELDLTKNRLKQIITNEPVVLPSLYRLELTDNQLTELNFSIWNAPSLRELMLTRNNFTELPFGIGRFTHLVSLQLGYNRLTVLDLRDMENLSKLYELNANGNRLHTVLPVSQSRQTASVQCVLLSALEHIILSNNNLTTIDFNLWDMPSLSIIDLDGNRLNRLYISFNKFPKLRTLVIGKNFFSCLDMRSFETYIENYVVIVKSEDDNSTCPTNSSIKHPLENGVICCND